MNILKNVSAIFTDIYFHYKDLSKETVFERNIEEKTKSKNWRLNEIKQKEQKINNDLFKEYFKYQSPSNMYKKLNETVNTELNQMKVDNIRKILIKLQKIVDYETKDKTYKVEENEKIISIVNRILVFNQQNQQGKGLKILTPSQMLNRLPISLAQSKAKNNLEKLKNEIRQLLYSLNR